jgi:hypothetical protein
VSPSSFLSDHSCLSASKQARKQVGHALRVWVCGHRHEPHCARLCVHAWMAAGARGASTRRGRAPQCLPRVRGSTHGQHRLSFECSRRPPPRGQGHHARRSQASLSPKPKTPTSPHNPHPTPHILNPQRWRLKNGGEKVKGDRAGGGEQASAGGNARVAGGTGEDGSGAACGDRWMAQDV